MNEDKLIDLIMTDYNVSVSKSISAFEQSHDLSLACDLTRQLQCIMGADLSAAWEL